MDEISLEGWIWYPIVICVVMARYISQWISHSQASGLRKFRLDDYIMLFATCTYTVVIVGLYEFQQIQDNVNWDDLDPASDDYVYYEHLTNYMIMLFETTMQVTLWCNKTCLLIMYKHFTRVTIRDRILQVSTVILAISFSAVIISLYTECQPFSDTFLFDPGSYECESGFRYNVIQTIVNTLTDVYLIVLFWVMLSGLKLPLVKKALLLCIFSMGLFVIAAAVLTKVSVFRDITGISWIRWYFREVSMVMLIGNLTVCFPLLLITYRYCREHIPTRLTYLRGKATSSAQSSNGSPMTEKRSYQDTAESHSRV